MRLDWKWLNSSWNIFIRTLTLRCDNDALTDATSDLYSVENVSKHQLRGRLSASKQNWK